MLFRAVTFLLLTSDAWAIGIPFESAEGVLVEQVIGGDTVETICHYGFINPNSSDKAGFLSNCALEEGGGSIQNLSSINHPDETLPSSITLVRGFETNEGIDELEEQFVRYTDSEQREARAIHGNSLGLMTVNRDEVFSHTFEYSSEQGQTYVFPKLSNRIRSLSLRATEVPIEGQDSDDIHISAYLVDTSGGVKYWLRAADQTLEEGYWATGDSMGLPSGLDSFIDMTIHPEYASVAGGASNNGFVVSYDNLDEAGLWLSGRQFDGNSLVEFNGQVSPVDISQSQIIKTHKGLAQFYIEERDEGELKVAHLRFIEESESPSLLLESTDEFQSLESVYSQAGTLYIGYFENGSDLVWHSKATNELNYAVIPDNMNRLEGCKADRERIFCIMSDFSENAEQCEDECDEGLFLFELIDGEFVKDRILDHTMLDRGMISFSGIYAYGKNRFLLLQTVDHKYRLFNLTLAGTFYNKKIDNRNLNMDVSIVPGITKGNFFLVFAANQSAETVRISANLNEDSKAGDGSSGDGDASDDTGSEDKDKEEEDKEVPFAEMEGSLNIYLLMLALLILMPLRLAKK